MLKSESGVWLINFGKFINFIKVCNMNYLAHACLSFGKPDILLGNMINDFIKGKKQFDYPAAIQKGICCTAPSINLQIRMRPPGT